MEYLRTNSLLRDSLFEVTMETKADWLRSEIKKWFEINYLDGDEVQDGQMLASSECLDALVNSRVDFLRSEIEKLEGMKKTKTFPQQLIHFDHSVEYFERLSDADIHYNQAITSIITRYKEELEELTGE